MPGPATSKMVSVPATLLVLATVAVGVPHAQAAFPGRNGALALGGWASSGSCGEQVPRLGRAADSDGCAFQPPSPALYLAWLDRRRTERSFWPMCEGGFRGDARFSPGGARLVCRTRAGRIVVRSAGSAVDLGAGARAAWSPDGSRVVIEQRARLYVRQVGGGHAQFLRLGSSPAWSKRGEIAYVRDETLFVMDSRGRRPREIASSKLRRHIEVGPDWSPDGERIAFAACPTRRPCGVYAVTRLGTGLRRITYEVDYADFLRYQDSGRVVWSPDARKIAFTLDNGSAGAFAESFLVSARASRPQGRRQWRRISRYAAVFDWQALPTRRDGR